MDMKQILLLGLVLVPVWTCGHRCYTDSELGAAARRKLSSHYPQPPEPGAAARPGAAAACPGGLYAQHAPPRDHSQRSLSPWRYVHKTLDDHFPSTYAQAECLCRGCIVIQKDGSVEESHDYNSVLVEQSRVFLKREPCGGGGNKYSLRPVSIKVAVGCTCVRATSSS